MLFVSVVDVAENARNKYFLDWTSYLLYKTPIYLDVEKD